MPLFVALYFLPLALVVAWCFRQDARDFKRQRENERRGFPVDVVAKPKRRRDVWID